MVLSSGVQGGYNTSLGRGGIGHNPKLIISTRKDNILLRVTGFLGDSKFLSKAVQVISLKKVKRL